MFKFDMSRGPQVMEFDYVNYKGEESHRVVVPYAMVFGSNQFHLVEQALLLAFDTDKKEMRSFAAISMSNIRYTILSIV